MFNTHLIIWVGFASLQNHWFKDMIDLVLQPELILLSFLLSLLIIVTRGFIALSLFHIDSKRLKYKLN